MLGLNFKTVICIIALGFLQLVFPGDKVKIKLHPPPPNQLGAKDLWKLDITNTSRENIKIFLSGSVNESKKGTIVSGKSKVISVSPGTKTYTYEDFKSGEVNWKDRSIQEVLQRTGNVPEGEYTICVTPFFETGEPADNESCIDQSIQQRGTITLITPDNGSEVSSELPMVFSWTPLPNAKEYKLRIVEIKGGQSPEAALKNNTDIFSVTSSTTTYTPRGGEHLPWPLPKKKKYAWQVSSGSVQSEAWTIETKNAQAQVVLVSPSNGEQITPSAVTFKWNHTAPQPTSYRLRVWQLMQGQNGTQAMKSNNPVVTKIVENASEITIEGLYTGACKPPYLCDFVWNIELMNGTNLENGEGNEAPYNSFSMKQGEASIVLVSPSRNEQVTSETVTFRWESSAPKPQKYRLKVWQLMEGQNGTQAMKTNDPVITKIVENTNEVTVESLPTGPCKPPYLCDFVWSIELIDGTNLENGLGGPIHDFYRVQRAGRLIDVTLISPAPGTEVTPGNPVEFQFEISGDVTEEDQFEVIIAELGENDAPGVTKKTYTFPHILESSGPISSPKKGKHSWWGMSANNSGYDPDKRYVWTVRSTGDPIHGVDVKLGVKSMQGDPIHGVDVKLGKKKSDGTDPNNPKTIDHQVWENFGTKVSCERLGVTFQAAKKIGVNQYRLFAEFTNIIYYQTTAFVNNHPLPEPNIISYEQLFPPVSDPRLFCDEDGRTISRLNGIWKVTEQNTRNGGYVDLGSIPPVNFTLFTLVNLWNNNFPDNLGNSCRCSITGGWTSGWEGGSPWIDSLISHEENRPPEEDSAKSSHWHPDIVIYDSGKIIALSGKDTYNNVIVYMNEARLLELAGEQLANLKISKEDFLKKLNLHLLAGEVSQFNSYAYQPGQPVYGGDGCKNVYCNNPNHSPGCGWQECAR